MKLHFTTLLLLSSVFLFGADYYWVGGSGNWSDISHWAASSGGTVTYPVAPSSEDNVIFDQNSFTAPGQVVTFQNNIVFCKSMNWSQVTNNPTLTGSETVTVSLFGDITLSVNMTLSFQGKLLLAGVAEDKIIDLAGHTVPGTMQFAGESTWSFAGSVNIDSMLEISRGNVIFNGNPITCRFLHINTTGQKSVDIAGSTVSVTGTYQPEYGYNGNGSISLWIEHTNLEMNATSSSIDVSAADPEFRYLGVSDLMLNELIFSATTGSAYLTSNWFEDPIDINTLTFGASARVEGTLNIGELSLAAGGRYRFGAERTYEIGSIVASSDCVEGVIVISDNPGFPATFNIPGGNIDLNYITLRDIHGSGGATLNANNGVDLGNNDGWNFTNAVPVNYYWVGGSGRWNDEAHWSLSSGGPSSGCVPSGKDNAFFDTNSFTGPNQSVELASRSTFIHDMTWRNVTDEPEFTGIETQRIVVTGSLELDANMEHDIQGFYDFESAESGNTIRSNGKIFNESISFSGVEGDWTLLDDMEVFRFIYFRSGDLSTGGNQLTTTRLLSRTELPRSIDISDSYVLLRETIYDAPQWIVDIENYSVNAANSRIELLGRGTFQHDGYLVGGIKPHYNVLDFQSLRAVINSRDQGSPESETAVIIDEVSFSGRGDMAGSSEIGILRLAEGFSYVFDSNLDRRQVVGELVTGGSCSNGTTLLFGSAPGIRANIELLTNTTLDRMYFTDIRISGSTLTNNNSVDGGNNEGMTFTALMGRTLYWVGDAGIWQDPAHWSLNSGGLGGECIPTALDDIIFDENSFSSLGALVEGVPSLFAHCKNLRITETSGLPQIRMNFILVNGSVELDESFLSNIDEYIFTSSEVETITAGGQRFNYVRMRGAGMHVFEDDIRLNNFIFYSGEVTLNSINVECERMIMEGDVNKVINLEGSQIRIYDSGGFGFNDRNGNTVINPGMSTIFFPGEDAGVFSRNMISLNKVVFENTSGSGLIASRTLWDVDDITGTMTINSLRFNGEGTVVGHMVSDTLIGVAGKVYTLESSRNFDISSYFQLRGNNCTPIELRSSRNAERARINMPVESEIVVDFVQMSDMEGSGGADFNAGSRSVNVGGSNVGWTFTDAPDFIESGFLGTDLAICEGEPVELSAFSYSDNEQYMWSDGSTDSILLAETPGQYFVEVQFESNCVLRDSVTIVDGQIYETELPDSSVVCGEDLLNLDATVVADHPVEYLWNVGSVDPVLEVSEEGKYKITVQGLGCTTEDSTYVTFVADPEAFLPGDTSLCDGDQFIAQPLLSGESYAWNNGFADANLIISEGGIYWLELGMDGCLYRDTMLVESLESPFLELGNDTSICEGTDLELNVDFDLQAVWSDGSTGTSYVVAEATDVRVVATGTNGCISSDSISIFMTPSPQPELGEDITVCDGEEVVLSVPAGYEDYMWTDGLEDSIRRVTEGGDYELQVVMNGCRGTDVVRVNFLELPRIDLGPADTIACEQIPLRIMANRDGENDLMWQDLSEEAFFDVSVPGIVTASVFDGRCFNSDSISVTFKDCVFFEYYAPNAFSPNDDGHNDRFQVFFPEGLIIESYEMAIFDRWGNRVYDDAEIGGSWDGTLNSSQLEAGVYVFKVNVAYIDENGPGTELIVGDIAIVK